MTRKDYVALASALHHAKPRPDAPALRRHNAEAADAAKVSADFYWRSAVLEVAEVLAADNHRFDRQRFVTACEVGSDGR